MNDEWLGFLYFIWWLMTGADGVGALLAALRIREATRRSAVSMRARKVALGYKVLLFGLAAEAFLTVLSLYFFQDKSHFTQTYILGRVIGRTIKAICVWFFVLYVLGIRNGSSETDSSTPPPPVVGMDSGVNVTRS